LLVGIVQIDRRKKELWKIHLESKRDDSSNEWTKEYCYCKY